METAQFDRQELAAELAAARASLDEEEQHIVLTLYGLLARGEPVPPSVVVERAGVGLADVEGVLDKRGGVYFDDEQRIVGFWGMALAAMPHRMRINGSEVRGWCAWDTLFLPELIGETVTVESPCPTTGETVRLVVAPDAVLEVAQPVRCSRLCVRAVRSTRTSSGASATSCTSSSRPRRPRNGPHDTRARS
jgi:hypothetical protein